jgi:hypothetical protein
LLTCRAFEPLIQAMAGATASACSLTTADLPIVDVQSWLDVDNEGSSTGSSITHEALAACKQVRKEPYQLHLAYDSI